MPETTKSPSLAPGKPCPICGKPAVDEFRPFCSARCKDVDLNRWLSGAYVVPGRTEEDEDGDGGSGSGSGPADR